MQLSQWLAFSEQIKFQGRMTRNRERERERERERDNAHTPQENIWALITDRGYDRFK